MADRKPLDQDDVKRQQEAAASAKLREIMFSRARETPAAPRLSEDGANWEVTPPQNLMERGSDQGVYTQEPDGGAKKVGIDMYVAGDMPPLDPSTLRQDWGDARLSQTSNPDQTRDYTLDGTVRYEDPNFIARDARGDDEVVPPDAVQGYLNTIGDQPGYELYGDAAKKAFERLGQTQPTTEPPPAKPDLRSMLMPKKDPRYAAISQAVASYGNEDEQKKGMK